MMKNLTLHVKPDGSDKEGFRYDAPGSLEGAIKVSASSKGGRTIYLHKGVYRLTESLCFGPEMSGTEFISLCGNDVIFDAGLPVSGWGKLPHS